MNFNEFYDHCSAVFQANPTLPKLDEQKARKLYKLAKHMLEINEHMNLTAIKDEKSVILKHYADCLAICEYIKPNSTVIDVGCGAGFPTLPLAIFRPDVQITALDSTAKRIDYVATTAELLELDNVTAIAERAEVLAKDERYREKFDYATARAVASLPVLTELCLPFVRIGGQFIAMKAQKAESEINASMNAIKKCGGVLTSKTSSPLNSLDGTSESRVIVSSSKIQRTPADLPRHYSKISKKPL